MELIDFNVDGKLDAALGSGELALGKGDGTFSLTTPLFPQPSQVAIDVPIYYPLLQATLFPNSMPSLVYLNFSGGNAVFTPADSSSAAVSVPLTAGSHSLTAHYSGDATYAPSVSNTITVTVGPAATKVTVTSSANPSYTGENVTFNSHDCRLSCESPQWFGRYGGLLGWIDRARDGAGEWWSGQLHDKFHLYGQPYDHGCL